MGNIPITSCYRIFMLHDERGAAMRDWRGAIHRQNSRGKQVVTVNSAHGFSP